MSRTCNQTARQQGDHQSSILASTSIVKTTCKIKSEMEGRPFPSPGTHMDEVGPRQMLVEAIQGGVPSNRREQFFKEERNRMMMMMMTFLCHCFSLFYWLPLAKTFSNLVQSGSKFPRSCSLSSSLVGAFPKLWVRNSWDALLRSRWCIIIPRSTGSSTETTGLDMTQRPARNPSRALLEAATLNKPFTLC